MMISSPPIGADVEIGAERISGVREARSNYLAQTSVAEVASPVTRKQSAVGVIPKDWQVMQLHEVAQVQSGIAKNAKRQVRNAVDVHYLRVANVQDGYLDLSEMSTLRVSREELVRYAVLPGDVLMNEGGDLDQLGRGSIWRGEFEPCVHQNHVFVVRCRSGLLPEFLNAWTSSTSARRYFLLAGKQTTNLASINKTALGELPVLLPGTDEQRAIAEALSDVDGLLGAFDALIAKKRAIKQAAMQQLLTGKTRLPGYGGSWRSKRLGELADVDPENLPSSTSAGFSFNYISLENVESGRLTAHSEEVFRTAPSRARRVLRTGDVLMATVRPNLMAHLHFQGQIPRAICSTGFAVLRARSGLSDPLFLFAQIFGFVVNSQIEKLIAGSNYPAINSRDVKSLVVPCPPTIGEQSAVAVALSDMDSEISALERRRNKTCAIKQGMMQQLLTGRVRLVQPAMSTTGAATP
jgi:type I restriction enzyme S subunit